MLSDVQRRSKSERNFEKKHERTGGLGTYRLPPQEPLTIIRLPICDKNGRLIGKVKMTHADQDSE